MLKIFAVVFISGALLRSEVVPVCMAVTEADAQIILGPSAKRSKDPSGCQWEDAGHKTKMNLVRIGVASMFERAREGSAREGTTRTENGLGGPAFSTIPSAHKGSRAAIYLLKGSGILVVDIDGFGPGGAVEMLPQVRDLIRKLVPKI